MNATIRPATPGDADAVAGLLAELGYPTDFEPCRRRIIQLSRNVADRVFIAVTGEGILGLASLHVMPVSHRDDHLCRLTAFVVAEAHRGKGVARLLIQAVVEFAGKPVADLHAAARADQGQAHLMTVFQGAVDATFAAFGIDAAYTPAGGEPVPVRVIAKRPDAIVGFDEIRIHAETPTFEVRASEIANPRPDDQLTVAGETFVIQVSPSGAISIGLCGRSMLEEIERGPQSPRLSAATPHG